MTMKKALYATMKVADTRGAASFYVTMKAHCMSQGLFKRSSGRKEREVLEDAAQPDTPGRGSIFEAQIPEIRKINKRIC